MADFILHAKPRETTGKKVKGLRGQGLLPAVLFGHGKASSNLQISLKEFENIFEQAGSSNLVKLVIADGEPVNVLIQEPQIHPVTDQPLHVDFYRVKMDEKIKTTIPLEFIGIAPAVEQLDGTLVTNKDELSVECLPGDLVDHISVDLSFLKTFEDIIHVKDLKIPTTIAVTDDPEEVVTVVEPPRSEEELAELEKPTAEEEAEAVEKVTAEEEKPAEGEEGETVSPSPEGEAAKPSTGNEKKPEEKK